MAPSITSPAATTIRKMRIIVCLRPGTTWRALACPAHGVLAFAVMTRNTALKEAVPLPEALAGRSIVLVGLMGAGKTSIGRRLAARLGLPFRDADAEIELAAGCTIPELFSRYGEGDFRAGERRVIRRLLSGDPLVLAFGGGAFMDPETRGDRARGGGLGLAALPAGHAAAPGRRRATTARCWPTAIPRRSCSG